jgi:hypothetical protein
MPKFRNSGIWECRNSAIQGLQGKAGIEQRPKRTLEELGDPDSYLEALLGLFSSILAFG